MYFTHLGKVLSAKSNIYKKLHQFNKHYYWAFLYRKDNLYIWF